MVYRQNLPWFFFLIPILLGLFGVATTASAQDPQSLTIDVEIGFDGYVKTGVWAPVRVQASNQGPDLDGEILVQTDYPGETYARSLSLPSQSQKEITILIPVRGSQVTVEFVSDNDILFAVEKTFRTVTPAGYMVGIIAPDPALLNFLAGLQTTTSQEPVTVAHLDLDDISDLPESLSALDALVFNDIDTLILSSAQQASLKDWLEAGGTLVVGGGPNGAATASGLSDLLPVLNLSSQTLAHLDGLEAYIGEPVPMQGPYIAALPEVTTGKVYAMQEGLPLLVHQRFGQGQSLYFALDFGLAPMNGWAGNTEFWESALAPLDGRVPFYAIYSGVQRINDTLANINVAGLPSPLALLTYLCSYLLFLVPLNYFALKRFNRLEWAWITIPGLIFLFSLVGYIAGFRSRGGSVIVRQVSVIQQAVNATSARVDSFIGVYSPTRNQYTLRFGQGVLAQPTQGSSGFAGVKASTSSPTTIYYGEQTEFRNLWTDVGSMSMMVVHGRTQARPVNIDLSLRQEGRNWVVSGTIDNQTGETLVNSFLLVGDFGVRLDNIPPGQMTILEGLQNLSTQSYGDQTLWGEYYYQLDDPDLVSHDQVVRGLFWPDGNFGQTTNIRTPAMSEDIRLVGWQNSSPSEAQLQVLGRRIQPETLNLLVINAPVQLLQFEQGRRQ